MVAAHVALAQDRSEPTTPATPRCEVSGVVDGLVVRTRAPRRRVTLDETLARVAPLRRGLWAVVATLPDGTSIEGTSRGDIPVEIAAPTELGSGALLASAGARVLDVEPIDGTSAATIDVVLAPGAVARRVHA